MKVMRLGVLLLGAAAGAACGEGRAIFNVDVLSFIARDIDTIPYAAPPVIGTYSLDATPTEISLLSGLGNSTVDTVQIDAGANLINAQGDATVTFELYFAADQVSVYSGTPYLTASGVVSGAATTPIGAQVVLTDALFSEPTLWLGIRVRVQNTAAAVVSGDVALTALTLRIVLDDRVF
jgi:hypothetical protein